MKKLVAMIIGLIPVVVFAQGPYPQADSPYIQGNPKVDSAFTADSLLLPIEENGSTTLGFRLSNTGTEAIWAQQPNNTMQLNISMLFGDFTQDPATLLAAIGGTMKDKFTWEVMFFPNDSIYHYRGTLKADSAILPGEWGTITMHYDAIRNTYSDQAMNGFNCNIAPDPYTQGYNNLADDNVSKFTHTVPTLYGNVFNDVNGLTDGILSGDPIVGSVGMDGTPVNVALIDAGGNVIAVTTLSEDGTYVFRDVPANVYNVVMTTEPVAIGDPESASVLPEQWVNVGEGEGVGLVDGLINGIISFIMPSKASVTNMNFGVEKRPTAVAGGPTQAQNNAGTVSIPVDNTSFGGNDEAPGTVDSILITGVPAGATSITIGGTNYTPANFPANGVMVEAPGGIPTPVISVDPVSEGTDTLSIPYVVYDNAGVPSQDTANALLQLTADPLPLDLLTFNARKDGSTVLLNWNTVNEINTSHFDVMHSEDGKQFEVIGNTEAMNKPGENRYSFIDNTPVSGANYYRLKMIDQDGSFKYSDVKVVVFGNSKVNVNIYPNPATDRLNVELAAGDCNNLKAAVVKVFDIAGKEMFTEKWQDVCNNPKKVLHVGMLSDGDYLIQVTDNNNNMLYSGKFVKSN